MRKAISWIVVGTFIVFILFVLLFVDFKPEPCYGFMCPENYIPPTGFATVPSTFEKWKEFVTGHYPVREFMCTTPPTKYFLENSSHCFFEYPAKPVIYLYPDKKEEVNVRLDFNGTITSTYPTYNSSIHGWNVIASPNGTLINKDDNKEYSYLFWEGKQANQPYDLSKVGFVIAGKDTKDFFQKTLSSMGLMPKEYNEFIVYWLPKLEINPYNEIYFAGSEYTDNAQLSITPKPDAELRIFMLYKPLTNKISLPQQEIKPFERKGFTVIEWGGTEVN